MSPALEPKADPLDGLDAFVEKSMQDWHVPGVALGIVKDGKVVHAKGYGLRDVDKGLPVTADTVFALASVSKAFTSASVGIAVDEGKLEWDRPVRNFIPWFKMYDEVATQRLTVRDMMCHRSGLPRHDGIRINTDLTRREMVERLRYLEPNKDIRTAYQYNNLMFISAGHMVGELEGVPWEDVVRRRILDVIGMRNTHVGVPDTAGLADYAHQYAYADGKYKEFPYGRRTQATCPCGGIYSTVNDMVQWILLHLGDGTWNGKRILTQGTLNELHEPEIIIRGGERMPMLEEFSEIGTPTYAMGWAVDSYRGHRIVSHGGNVEGISTLVGFVPEIQLGYVILTNAGMSMLRMVLSQYLFDRFFGLDVIPWNERLLKAWGEVLKGMAESTKAIEDTRVKDTLPSRPLAAFTGRFEHPGYGALEIRLADGKLEGMIGTSRISFAHHHYDVFKGHVGLFQGIDILATFSGDAAGRIDRLSMPLEPLVSPIVFRRVASAEMSDVGFLAQFVGKYEFLGMQVEVALLGTKLTITVPGEGNHDLVPVEGARFEVAGLPGYGIEFTVEAGGQVRSATVITRLGRFPAARAGSAG